MLAASSPRRRGSAEEARRDYGLELAAQEALQPAGAVVIAVAHRAYREGGWPLVQSLPRAGRGVVAAVKGILHKARVPEGCRLWRL